MKCQNCGEGSDRIPCCDGPRVTDIFVEAAHEAVEDWDGVDNVDLVELLADRLGVEFRDLVRDALFRVQANDTTRVEET